MRSCPLLCPISFVLGISALAGCAAPPPQQVRDRLADISLPAETVIVKGTVPVHATVEALLGAQQLGRDMAQTVVSAMRGVFAPRSLRAGQDYRLVLAGSGQFRSFEYEIDRDQYLRVERSGDADADLKAEILSYPKTTSTAAIAGLIDRAHPSLVSLVDDAGEEVGLALRLADIFSGQLDFTADLQPGDRIEALFEKETREGEFAGYGAVLAATIVNEGRHLQAFRFVDEQGEAGYYDEDGRSVRRFFLRSPLPFTPRVTSRFSLHRLHPVFGVRRAHLGVDYAAPTGTPVLAVADGTVISAGFSGGSGRLVRLRHAGGYQTYYLHLSAITKGLRPGVHVSQGEVIGRVGSSGVATGPHLDYRLRKGGVFVDPLVEHKKLPPGEPVPADRLAAFASARDAALMQLTALRGTSTPDAVQVATLAANSLPAAENEEERSE
jgi:murein DD-endopeptidase MepM/ murein hydrolase activator NlpD